MSEINWDEFDEKSAARWAREQIAEIREGSIEQATEESAAAKDSDGIAAARALESLVVRIERYRKFLVEHNARSEEMEAKQWARELIQEGLRFWGQVSGAVAWGEFFFCKMVGISCDVEENDGQELDRSEDGGAGADGG